MSATTPIENSPVEGALVEARRGPGRPRRYDHDVEEQIILDAGLRVMRHNGYAVASVADILHEADVSSRAFYRHFPSKDALLLALFRRDSTRVVAQLEKAVESAPSPSDAVFAWLDGYLDLFYDPRRAARAAVMNSEGARRADGYAEELKDIQFRLTRPLADSIRRGVESGELTSPDPEFDAAAILSLVGAAAGSRDSSPTTNDRDEARSFVLRFVAPAIGLAERSS